MKLDQWKEKLLTGLYVCETGVLFMQLFDFQRATSFLFMMTFPLTVLLWAADLMERRKLDRIDLTAISGSVLAFVFVCANAAFAHKTLSFSYLKKCIMFVMTMLHLDTVCHVKMTLKVHDVTVRLLDFATIGFIIMYFGQGIEKYLLYGSIRPYLTFKFTTPNLVAMFLLCLLMMQLIRLMSASKRTEQILRCVASFLLVWFIVETKSRNTQLALAVFLAGFVLIWLNKIKQVHLTKSLSAAISCMPALFFAAYMLLVENPVVQSLFSFMVSEGKKLSSRMEMWTKAWTHFKDSFVIGAYCQISDRTGTGHMHNTHVDVAASYGLIVLILVCVLLYFVIRRTKRVEGKIPLAVFLAFFCCIMLGFGEAAFFSGGLGIYLLFSLFPMMLHSSMYPLNDHCDELTREVTVQLSSLAKKTVSWFRSLKVKR